MCSRFAQRRYRLPKAVVGLIIALALAAPVYSQPSTGTSSPVGYIDNAVPMNQMRLRFDSAHHLDHSERAEYIYSKGPPTVINYRDYSWYVEGLVNQRMSWFMQFSEHVAKIPDTVFAGFGDMHVGFKSALIYEPDEVFTLQLQTYIPTGQPRSTSLLGTGHVSLEPGLLYYRRLTERWILQAELKDWIAIGGSDFAGNVLQYGVGISRMSFDNGCVRFAPVAEFLGWTVLSGREAIGADPITFDPISRNAAGETIINAKMGGRLYLGDYNSLYIGYGRALTGDVWYKEIMRIEFRFAF